jgi:hypothetical protein
MGLNWYRVIELVSVVASIIVFYCYVMNMLPIITCSIVANMPQY